MTWPAWVKGMMMSGDLAAFLAARLDEDEAAANAGARRVGMPWRAEPQPGTPGGLVLDELGLVGSTGGRYAAEHIACHDPARVLRDVEAKRAILELYTETLADLERAKMRAPSRPLGDKDLLDTEFEARILRPVIESLAAVWSDHPDYDAGRKP